MRRQEPEYCTCHTGGEWGMRHLDLESGRVLAEDPSSAWYYDPVTGDMDIALFVSPSCIRKQGRRVE